MKRFYKIVSIMGDDERGYSVQLDGKAVKTPSGHQLVTPTEEIAELLATEWRDQQEQIDPETMPVNQLMVTALDRVSQEREDMTRQVLAYLDTDLICYRVKEPQELRERQEAAWDIWLSWFEKNFRYMLEITDDLKAVRQNPEAHKSTARRVRAYGDLQFTVLQTITAMTGSLVLALAFMAGAATPDHLFGAVYVEEDYKAEIYNETEHGLAPLEEKKRAIMKRDLDAARRFLDALSKK